MSAGQAVQNPGKTSVDTPVQTQPLPPAQTQPPADTPHPATRLGDIPRWFFVALLIGLGLRLYLVYFTTGTLDVDVWERHAATLNQRDLISYYQGGTYRFNHPPPIAEFFRALWSLGRDFDVPFQVLLRLPFALLDGASVWLIVQLLAGRSQRFAIAALYWLHPLALIYSSHHGNTDSSVAFFLLATTLLTVRNRPLAAGVLLGLSLWIKLPGALAGPVFFFALPGWNARARLCGAFAASALVGYLPALLENADAVINGVFLYSGLALHTGSGIAAWGIKNVLPAAAAIPAPLRLGYLDTIQWMIAQNTLISVGPIVLLAWLRRREKTVDGIAITIFGSYALLYGLTHYWAFQYFAWALPFWLLAGWRIGLASSFFATFYIYGLYAWLCGDPFLLGRWDFLAKPDWPVWILWARDLANVYFLLAGVAVMVAAATREIALWRDRGGAVSESGANAG